MDLSEQEILDRADEIRRREAEKRIKDSFAAARDLKLQWTMWKGDVGVIVSIELTPKEVQGLFDNVPIERVSVPFVRFGGHSCCTAAGKKA